MAASTAYARAAVYQRISWLRVLAFIGLFCAMYVALASFWGGVLAHWVIDVCTVEPAAWLARWISGDSRILAIGSKIVAPDASINILFGCEGADVLMLLTAAVLVVPVSWRKRALGMTAGALVVFCVNQARVLALFFAFVRRPGWFGPIHGLIGPMLVVVAVTAFFLAWLHWTEADARRIGDAG